MEGEGDDQGFGWLEVKKKHRTSSKLSNQKVTEGSFSKRQAYSPQSCKTYVVGNSHSRRQVHPTNDGLSFSAHSNVTSDGYSSSAVASDDGIGCLDKVVDNKESGQTVVLSCMSVKVAASEGDSQMIVEVLTKQNVDVIPKIKWGDREDVPHPLPTGCGTSVKIVNTDGVGGLDVIMPEYADVVISGEPLIGASPGSPLHLGKVAPEGAELLQGVLSSDVHDEPTAQTSKGVNEVFSANATVANISPNDADENLEEYCGSETSTTSRVEPAGDMYPNDEILKVCPSSPLLLMEPSSLVGTFEEVTLDKLQDKSKDVVSNSSGASVTTENAGMNDDHQDSNLVPQISDAVEVLFDACIAEATEGQKGLQDDSTEGTDLGECQQRESKERFRERLWCFLFENLNRAVDELYLLCELECDTAQMNEANLVLEEAASDFKELKCRVEHFENTKRSTSQSSKDGVPVNMKTDHRRPHALSWEVRRMTTSPHRAEILSSSLEAFKKIQLERASKLVIQDAKDLSSSVSTSQHNSRNSERVSPKIREPMTSLEKQKGAVRTSQGNTRMEKLNVDAFRQNRAGQLQDGRMLPQNQSATAVGKSRREPLEPVSETDKPFSSKDRAQTETRFDKQSKAIDKVKKQNFLVEREEKEKEKHNLAPWRPMDAWKEKRNWEDILKSPLRSSTRMSHSPGLVRRGMERARVLHDKLMSPEKKKKAALDLKREAEDKHARAMRIRSQLENERVQRLQRTSEKLNRVNEWQAVRSMKLREGMYARQQQGVSRHEAYLAQVARRAGDESSKVNEVRFITSLNDENKKLVLRQKLHDSEMRRAEKLQVIRSKQKEDTAREEAALERRRLLEAEKLQRIAETQRKKEEAQVRREEERKASSAAREAKALVQLRKKEVRAKAQQEEAEVLAQKLAERLSESEQRRKSYLEQIRERASMDYRDQSSPLLRRSVIKEGQIRVVSVNSVEDFQTSCTSGADSIIGLVNVSHQQSLKRRIKKIRQRLMSLKFEFSEPSVSPEISGIGYRALLGTARAKIGRWLQELQRFRQARKEGAVSIGLIVGEMVKFLEGKDPELHASRQAGLLDFIASALPASHTSKPEACQVTLYLLCLLRVVLFAPGNRSYFLVQNLLPPLIPMLSASLENYIKIAASSSIGCSNLLTGKASNANLEAITEILDGFLWTVTIILGHACTDERQLQMQDGLLELIVSYQIIHRLRDLFALYDRPQVEGSPFPTSILLSLNLLAVLSSRSRTISSIDWKACISKAESENKVKETKSVESQHIGETTAINSPSEYVTTDFTAIDSTKGDEKLQSAILSPVDNTDSRPLDCQFIKEPYIISDSQGDRGTVNEETTEHEVQNIVAEEHTNSVSPLKDEKIPINDCIGIKRNECRYKQPVVFLLSVITETGLVGLPSLLTAVLLQANNRLSFEKSSYILPSNFEEVATGVLKVLNNLALLDIAVLQRMLARPDLKMELFHLMSFLLSYCTNKWKTANDQVGVLLLESLLLLGCFALFHPGNQAVLRWGKSPTILHKVCDLPFVFFSDPELTPILASTLVAACFGCDQNRGLVLQELSVDMLLSLLKSCRQDLLAAQSTDVLEQQENYYSLASSNSCGGSAQQVQESKRPQGDIPLKPNRRGTRGSLGKGGASGSSTTRALKAAKMGRDGRGTKTCDEWALKHSLSSSETSHTFMLHQRFPTVFLDRAEEFFMAGSFDLLI